MGRQLIIATQFFQFSVKYLFYMYYICTIKISCFLFGFRFYLMSTHTHFTNHVISELHHTPCYIRATSLFITTRLTSYTMLYQSYIIVYHNSFYTRNHVDHYFYPTSHIYHTISYSFSSIIAQISVQYIFVMKT